MRGGSYRIENGQRQRLDRKTGEWLDCDEKGVELPRAAVAIPAAAEDPIQVVQEEESDS